MGICPYRQKQPEWSDTVAVLITYFIYLFLSSSSLQDDNSCRTAKILKKYSEFVLLSPQKAYFFRTNLTQTN
jgi:hypothetical protein